ncbi:MAG TPA: DMT family transporter [Candidatus Limnocylindrales bacterium]|nr:DMT family transporter [Candidatus Limnocylindrales bacterium]
MGSSAEAGTGSRAAGVVLPGDRALGILLVVISACAFGSGALFARPVYAAGMDWIGLLAWRFLFGAAVAWLWLLARPANRAALWRLARRRLVVLVAMGILYTGNSGTYYAALESVPASLAALIVYIYPVLVAVLSIRWGRGLSGRRPWLALATASLGVALALGGIDPGAAPPLAGLLLAAVSPLIYSVWIVLSARLGGERSRGEAAAQEESDPAPATAVMMTATWAAWWLIATVTGRPVTPAAVPPEAWLGLLGVGVISTAVAIQAFYAGTRRIGAADAAMISTVEPAWTISLATLLFGEHLTPVQLLGGVLVIAAVLVAQRSASRTEPAVHAEV